MSGATEREHILAAVGLSLCAWVIVVVIAWLVTGLLDASRPRCVAPVAATEVRP